MTITRPRAGNQASGLAFLAVRMAVLSYVALELVAVPREWQVAICLILVAALGVVAGVGMRAVSWVSSAVVLTVVSTVVFAISCVYFYDTGRWWILSMLLFLPGAALAAFGAVGLGRAGRS